MSYYYHRIANYYETDMMAIVHHSNHIRWFEEARMAYMKSLGCNVMQMEHEGIIIPNVDAYAKYHSPIRFGDKCVVEVKLTKFTGTRMELHYTITKEDGELAATGHTMHCFVNSNFKPMSLKRSFPEYYQKLMLMVEEES